jgi:hypothetical protein
MKPIPVPRPQPKKVWNPDRPVSSLLQTQMRHLHDAERNLPLRYRSELYINAIQTEGEAAAYIRHVTEAIHQAHDDAAALRAIPRRKRGIAIAAAAERPSRKPRKKATAKKSKRTIKPSGRGKK